MGAKVGVGVGDNVGVAVAVAAAVGSGVLARTASLAGAQAKENRARILVAKIRAIVLQFSLKTLNC